MERFLFQKPFFEDKSAFVRLLYLLLLVLVGSFLAGVIAEVLKMIFYRGVDVSSSRGYIFLYQALSSVGTFLFPALCFSYFSTKNVFDYSNTQGKIPFFQTIVIFILSFCILPIVLLLGYFNDQMQLPDALAGVEQWMRMMENKANESVEFLLSSPTLFTFLGSVIVMAVIAAICEEYFFRGTLQPFLGKWMKNDHLAIWVTAFIFSAIHLQFYGFLPRFLLGAYLGYLFYWGRSIWWPILAHFFHNMLSISSYWISEKQGINIENSSPFDLPGFVPIVVMAVLLLIFGLYVLNNKKILKEDG